MLGIAIIMPRDFRVVHTLNSVHVKLQRRMFGEFECSCGNTWSSGNAWEGMGQQCRDCKEMILPRTLQPLRRSEGSGGGAHEQELCEMCQEIGGNCRELEENNSDDDAESVVSTISTVSSAGTVTPGEEYSEESGSSGSDTEDELADNLRRLTFPK